MVFRNLAFPRDPAAYDPNKLDHFADALAPGVGEYARGTVLAHAAYLMAAGGIHERAGRDPVHIPVRPLGRTRVGGRETSDTARVWYRAVTEYLTTLGAATGDDKRDADMFRKLCNAYLLAVDDVFAAPARARRTALRAFYAVRAGSGGSDGTSADVGFLPPAQEWPESRPYLQDDLPSPDRSSLDLYIDRGTALAGRPSSTSTTATAFRRP